jgi:hypothetical protein
VGDSLVAFFQNRCSWFLWHLVVLWPLARTAALDALLRSVDVLTGCNVMRTSIPHGQHDEANDEEDTGCRGSDSRSGCCSGGELAYGERVQDGRHSGNKSQEELLGVFFSR